MTNAERAAYNRGIEAMRQTVLAAAATLETREDGTGLRHQAAAAALQALADGARALMVPAEDEPAGEDGAPSLNTQCRRLMAGLEPLTGEPQS